MSDTRPTTREEENIYKEAVILIQKLKKEGKREIPHNLIANEPFNHLLMIKKAASHFDMYIGAPNE